MSQFDQSPPTYPTTPTTPGYQPYPTAGPGISTEDRNLGTIAHVTPLVLMLASGGLAGFLGSLVVYLYAKDRGPAARQYAATALNVQITVAIASAVSYVLMVVLVGFVTLPIVLVVGIIAHVVGALKANKGEIFEPPLTPTFVN